MRVSKKKLKIVCLIVAAILLTEGLTNILLDSKREVLAADVKEAVQADVYHFDSGKKTFACSIEQSNGLGFSFGEKEATVFGEEVAISDDETERAFQSDNGLLLRFRFQGTPFTLDAWCYRSGTDEGSIEDDIKAACFTDRDSLNTVLLVKTALGICFSEPEVVTKRFRNVSGSYYEILDKTFFADIKDELRDEFYIDDEIGVVERKRD